MRHSASIVLDFHPDHHFFCTVHRHFFSDRIYAIGLKKTGMTDNLGNIRYRALSRKGQKTSINQDCYSVPYHQKDVLQKGCLFAVADGLGGHAGGEIASSLCCESLGKAFYQAEKFESVQEWLLDEIKRINLRIIQKSLSELDCYRMGTTLVSLVIKDDMAYINNIGDSRLYLFSQNQLTQITEDHSVVWNYYARKLISKNEMIDRSDKHLVTQALGLNYDPVINSYFFALPQEFTFLLCSDGLTDVLIDAKIENILREYLPDLDLCAEKLYQKAVDHFSYDDITLILIQKKVSHE